MTTYSEFHGRVPLSEIEKRLRVLARGQKAFKILTGYGSSGGTSRSKEEAIKALRRMKKQGVIKGFIPGEEAGFLQGAGSEYYDTKMEFYDILRADRDSGNDGIIFVFVR